MSHPAYASHKIFQDNFDDGNAGGWVVTRNPCIFNGSAAEWKVVSGALGIKINGGSCVTEIMPNDTLWNSLGDDYVIEFDMKLVSGTDHNFAWRYTDPDHWYDFHIQSPGLLIMQRMFAPPGGSNSIAGDFSNGQTIHFKIVVQGDHVQLYRGTPSQLLYDNPNMGGDFPTGRIALQASAGGVPASETYFDNIVVTNIDDVLPVPYYSQNALPWGPQEYDDAISLGFSNITMNRWGCAVTSAVMVLNYHKMTEFADGTPINPGTLNDWLKLHNGYDEGYSKKDGNYSYLIWEKIAQLTRDLFNAGKSTTKLVHRQVYPSASTSALLDEDLTVRGIPDILMVKNASTSSHFVVAKGVLGGGNYALNDPEWNVPDLSLFNTQYFQVDRFVPSNTDFSYLVFVVNKSAELLVTDSQGRRTGIHVDGGFSHSFDEIPGATYVREPAISNGGEQLGSDVNVFYLPEPENGDYHITSSSITNTDYTLNVGAFETDGDSSFAKTVGMLNPGIDDELMITYSDTQPLVLLRSVTFQSAREDVQLLSDFGLIEREPLARQLIRFLTQAEEDKNAGLTLSALRRLNHIEQILNRERGNRVAEDAYQILLYDVNYLKNHL